MTDDQKVDPDLVEVTTVTLDAGGKNIIVLSFPDKQSAQEFEDFKYQFQNTVDEFISDDTQHVLYMTLIKGITLEVKKVQEADK